MGARGARTHRRTGLLTRPAVGIVTSVAMAHIEFFGDLEGVFSAKSELVVGLSPDGVAVLNFDDPNVRRMGELSPGPVLSYGIDTGADVVAAGVVLNDELQPSFTLTSDWGSAALSRLRLPRFHQVSNALAAATAASLWCGVPVGAVAAALADRVGQSIRMDIRLTAPSPTLIVDCYNANPTSTEAALRSLARARGQPRGSAAGRDGRAGPDSAARPRLYRGEPGRELGIRVVGYQTDLYGPDHVDDVTTAVEFSTRSLATGDSMLFKGSRVTRLEDVVRAYGEVIGDPSLVP